MYRIHQIKLPIGHGENELKKAILDFLGINEAGLVSYSVFKRSIDARKKPELFYIYAVDVELKEELSPKSLKRFKPNELSITEKYKFTVPRVSGDFSRCAAQDNKQGYNPQKPYDEAINVQPEIRPVVIGLGPAGLFCSYILALAGLRPLCFERGEDADKRIQDIEAFFNGEALKPESNVCFGEGGAGTFSDGKLNTLVKDRDGKGRFVLETFVKFGADKSILYDAKPHIGTDRLVNIVKSMRREIIRLGGEVHFRHRLEDLEIENGALSYVKVNGEKISAKQCVMATGHSARDVFSMLYSKGAMMQPKAFAIGVRAVHSQSLIDESQYGKQSYRLPPASYKLTHTCKNGRGVYSFCMCPGGYVVNASTEENGTVVNGMSYSGRDSGYANAAIICTVTPEDYEQGGFGSHPLSGVEFQRKYERLAYEAGGGFIPAQELGDFRKKASQHISKFEPETKPSVKGRIKFSDLTVCLPDFVSESIAEAMSAFDRKIKGFGADDVLLLGVETRTSSPVRIVRNGELQCEKIKGLFPCGEGAGYAGGIMSAALDGIKIAEKIISQKGE